MSNTSKREYIDAIRDRYRLASKRGKQRILDEVCQVCDYNRKYAIRLLNGRPQCQRPRSHRRPGPSPLYTHPDVLRFLKRLWKASNLACGKRLKAMIPLWLPFDHSIAPEARERLETISAATIDRLLAPIRSRHTKRGLATTKPGSLLKKHIPIKTNQWDEHIPGFLEAPDVSGLPTAGPPWQVHSSTRSIPLISPRIGRSNEPSLGKGEHGTLEALKSIEAALPFRLRGFDCDNGSEFINWTIYAHYTDRKRPVAYTRSREYHKNDNAHVEGKNWTHVRQYLGYERFDDPMIVSLLQDLYINEWRLLMNFFVPSVKLIDKQRIKSRTIKTYDPPKTPLQRVLESPHVAPRHKRKLKLLFPQLNPFILQQSIDKKIRRILAQASHQKC